MEIFRTLPWRQEGIIIAQLGDSYGDYKKAWAEDLYNATRISWNVTRGFVNADVAWFHSVFGQVNSIYFDRIRFARAPLDQFLTRFRTK